MFANTEWYLFNFRLPLAKALSESGVEVVFLSPPGPYGAKLKAEGFRWIPVPMRRRSLNAWSEANLIIALASIYRREQPDLVHHFTIKSVVYGSIAARIAGIKRRVNAIAGLGFVFASTTWLARLLRPIVRQLLKYSLRGEASRLIVQNPDDVNFFIDNKLVSPNDIRLIRSSGVDTNKFQPISAEGNVTKLRALLATRILWAKGVGEYVEAARLMQVEGVPITFLLAGAPDAGNPAAVPEEQIAAWDREGAIKSVGYVEEMDKLLCTVDLVVLPSYYREGVPRILLEAAASGLPIVSTDVPGCREIVEHEVNGLLVPPRDASSLAEAIKFLAGNPDVRARMGKEGRKKAVTEFDQQIVINATIDVYRELLSIPS